MGHVEKRDWNLAGISLVTIFDIIPADGLFSFFFVSVKV
jgi:hypothetical protein